MKKIICIFLASLFFYAVQAQTKAIADSTKKIITAEASCGQCNFGLKAPGCSLAVRIEGKAYFVDGTTIDDHGDAHASDGFCESIRKAQIQGTVVDNRFKATYFKLLPVKKAEATKPGSQP